MQDHKLLIKPSCMKRFMPVQKAIDELLLNSKRETLLIAIDGKCASGKTTLGYYLESLYACNLFHMDDFFLQEGQRTPQRLSEVGGNVDYERFQLEVLQPIKEGKTVIYRPFSCIKRKIKEEKSIAYKRLNIIEGSYSMHPYFKSPYDLYIFMNISEAKQFENICKRNGEEKLVRFREEWIPKENAYFEKFKIGEEDTSRKLIKINWQDI